MNRATVIGLLLVALFYSPQSQSKELTQEQLAAVIMIILKPQPWQQVCIKDQFGSECTPEYWCEDEPVWSRSPLNENHFILNSPCLTWRIECGDGEIISAPGRVCIVPVASDEGDYVLWLSLRHDEGFNIVVNYKET
jgi:hypothetical protein